MKSGFVEIGDNRVFYYQYGERGPKIVLLHGYGYFTQSLNFRNFLENMSDSYRFSLSIYLPMEKAATQKLQ